MSAEQETGPEQPTTPRPAPPDGAPEQPSCVDRATAALTRLHELDRRPVDEHVEVYDAIHDSLRAALTAPVHPA